MWRSKTKSNTGLKAVVRQIIINDVIKPNSIQKGTDNKNHRVLVVDQLGTKILSSCCSMCDICDEGIILVEDLFKAREQLNAYEAVYFITPNETSINALMDDFSNKKKLMYKAAHVNFIYSCPEQLFEKLRISDINKNIKTIKEINVAFIPNEYQVFSLNCHDMFQTHYNPLHRKNIRSKINHIAQQIATVCLSLGEYPSVRYRSYYDSTVLLAQAVQAKLDAYRVDYPSIGQGLGKTRSQLIVLDRGFDCMSPILHELTYQSMVCDNLSITDNVYKYVAAENDEPKEVVLDESDELWVKFRHEHIGVVTRNVTSDLKKFIDSNRVSSAVRDSHSTLRDFSKAIKAIPQYKKELSTHCTHLNMVQYCAEKYKDGMSRLCKVEQELALGTNVTGEKVDDHMKDIAPILLDKMVSNYDKVRIILLYVLSKNGISDESFNKMVKTAQLSPADKRAIVNLTLLGFNVVDNAKIKKPCLNKIILRGERHRDSIEIGDIGDTYEFSRWIPVVKYIMEDCIGNKLDPKRFPFVTPRTIITEPPPISARFSGGASNKKKENKQLNERLPKLIVFIIGGMTYSEMKCAYEVTNSTKNWEVIIGSSCIITPKDFIENLSNISQ